MSKGIYGLLNSLEEGRFKKYSKYPNVTKTFYEGYLPEMAVSNDGTFTLMTIAQRRWGKTALNFGVITVLMDNNPVRKLCCWDAPHLVPLILKERPDWEGRVYATDKIADVSNWSIIYMDEGLTKFNAKRALTKLSRKFDEALTYISHKQIILIVSAQTDGIMKGLRDKCEIVIYGRLPRSFLDASTHKSFLKAEFETLLTLPKEKCFVLSSAFGFIPEHEEGDKLRKLRAMFGRKDDRKRGIGMIYGDKRERCQWFTEEISRNMGGETLDTEIDKDNRDFQFQREVVDIILDEVPEEYLKNKHHIRGHFLSKHRDMYRQLHDGNMWNKVIDLLEYTRNDRNEFDKRQTEEKIVQQKNNVLIMEDKIDFPTFCRNWVLHEKKDSTLAEIVFQFLNETPQIDIAKDVGLAGGTINAKIKPFRHDHMGFLFEKWYAQMIDGVYHGENKNEPDVIGKDGTIYSLKAYYSSQTSLTFYQADDFHPEFTEAKKQKSYYDLVLYNPAWKLGGAVIVTIDPKGDERVVIRKPIKRTLEEYRIFPTIFTVKDRQDGTISDNDLDTLLEL